MLSAMSSFATSFQNMASYFSIPTIGGLYYPTSNKENTLFNQFQTFIKKVQDFFQVGVPIYPDRYEEKGGNEIGTQVLVGGVGNGNSNTETQPANNGDAVTGALVKVMDNVVVNPRSWTIHGYIGINMENSRALQVAGGLGLPSPFFNSFLRTFGRETLNSLMKKFLKYVSEARRPFKFTTAEGELVPALIKSYSLKNVPDNLNWCEVDLEVQEFRFIALLSNNEQEMVGGVNGLYTSSKDALRQLSRSTLKTIGIKIT